VALQPPETPEGPGWCGQGAARDQHGPALSGVASQRPNRLRGLSVEGRGLSQNCGKLKGRTETPVPRQCQTQKAKTLQSEKQDQHRPSHMLRQSDDSKWVLRDKQAARMGRPRHRPAETIGPCCLLQKGIKVKVVPVITDTRSRRLDCVRRGCGCGRKVRAMVYILQRGTATRRDQQQGPDHADKIRGPDQPVTLSEAGKLCLRAVQVWGADQISHRRQSRSDERPVAGYHQASPLYRLVIASRSV
jgi:hypothetical protein